MPTPLQLCQDQYNVISINYAGLMQRCTTADQQQNVRDLKDAALGNLIDAQNRIFDASNDQIEELLAQGEAAMNAVNGSIARIDDIVTTLNNITQAVNVAASIVALGTPK